ncbi:MAG: J domain-containing protein [Hyphomicrobiaceae bacterium]
MFERNRVDNGANSQHLSAIPAELTLDDGEILTGQFLIQASRTFSDVLNGEGQFFEFEPFGKERRFVSKQAIRSVKLLQTGSANALNMRKPADGAFDPYVTLGLKADAEWEDVRHAYLRLAKAYHADRYASVALPVEVRDYLQAMSRRINAAYVALEAPRNVIKKVSMRAAPVYTSPARG